MPSVQKTLEGFGVGVDDVPVLICSGRQVLKKPTIEEVAECLGLSRLSRDVVRDLVVIGAGPAGLAAAVYGASEGLDVLVLESTAPGGQAGSSSRIENYLGFPDGRLGPGPREQRAPAGPEVRRGARRRADGGDARVRPPALSDRRSAPGSASRRGRS